MESTNRLPFEIREALIEVCGKSFWYKDRFRSFMLSAGVPDYIYIKHSDQPKFVIARKIIDDLDLLGENGLLIQRKIITELCKLRSIPDNAVPNRDAAISALRELKELALNQKIAYIEEKEKKQDREKDLTLKQETLATKQKKKEELQLMFRSMVSSNNDPQKRGYSFELLLKELFVLYGIHYINSYKIATEQIDGYFEYKGFNYLVEARWRNEPPTEADLASFKIKVDKKLESTRGFFFSVMPFRPDVVGEFTRGISSNIILFDGADLSLVLEGLCSLTDALDIKIQKAAQKGIIYFPVKEYLAM